MNINKTSNLIDLFRSVGVLKDVKRTGWLMKGVKNGESVSDHSWRMVFMILFLVPENLNKQKLIEMALIHDVGEAGIGDIKWESGTKIIASQEEKHKDEMSYMKSLFKDIPNGQKYIDLLTEFNKQKSPEAKFLREVDKLEMVLQALDYQGKGYDKNLFNEFWENAEKYLKNGTTNQMFEELKKLR